jgi:hypothetical protein
VFAALEPGASEGRCLTAEFLARGAIRKGYFNQARKSEVRAWARNATVAGADHERSSTRAGEGLGLGT